MDGALCTVTVLNFLSLSNTAATPLAHTLTASRIFMSRFAVKTPSNRSSSPASSLTCVDLSSSFHKDHAEFKDMDVFGTVHEISLSPSQAQHSLDPPSPPSGTKSPLNLPKSPVKSKSPVKPKSPTRFEPYLKRRATAAATADFAMKSLRGQTAREMNPGAALMVSYYLLCSVN